MIVLLLVPLILAWLCKYRLARRFLTGQHLDGRRRSDGTFLYRGVNPVDMSGRVSSWAKLAGWERAGMRIMFIVLPTLFLVGLKTYPALTLTVVGVPVGVVLVCIGVVVALKVRTLRHTRRVAKPLADALGPVLQQHRGLRAREWVDVPQDYRTLGVTVKLPQHFAGLEDQQERVANIAAAKLGGEWEPTFNMQGQEPTLTLRHSPEPPAIVGWDNLAPYLAAAAESQPLLGLGSRGAPVNLDFAGDTPHVLISVPSGGGKSIAARIVAAHVLHHGGQVLILDHKKISHQWADGLPGVTYCREADEIHSALLELQQEISQRYSSPDPEHQRRLLVIVEELNQTADVLQAHWAARPKKSTLHKSPAVLALQGVLYTGRQCNVNMLVMAQKGTANAFGGANGGAARENATVILGAGSSESAWRMLAPDITPPARSTIPGRMHCVVGDTARTVQVGYLTDQQAQLWATTGTAQPVELEPEDEVAMLGFGTL